MTGGRHCRLVALVTVALVAVSGCSWRGLNSWSLPGTQGDGPGAFIVQAQMPNVNNIHENSRVRVGDVNVGTVTRIERQGWHALVTMRLNGDVELPANCTAMVGQTSLLGSLHLELAPPSDQPPQGRLGEGSVIPLSSAGEFPSTEQTLAAVSMLLNGGGLGQVQDINDAFSTAINGREDDLRGLLHQVDSFAGAMYDQTDDIIAATESLNRLMAQFASQRPMMDKALEAIPDAVTVLNTKRDKLIDALDLLGRLSALAADSTAQTKDAVTAELEDLGPVLESLANSGPALTRSLSLFTTYPFVQENLTKWFRGDFANITLLVDLTLSRIDSSFFTGTRFEGDLTELEMQWGRTIGQIPSPYTAANPLLAPYRYDQGS
ncbi:MCE family protein [Mycobacterium sp. ACS4331]|uniref:MCE family protein n=1 Tax=Mycobacterium sp. ACS4331 TaxID=1834121 RepID=UPI000800BAFB|nr:MCE family protein [Mycobacterium sp. ACS4331]OBF29689.1 mammalian cell entry protein [Mycobacterium sp. ACS4331]